MKALGIPLRRPVATGAIYLAIMVLGVAAMQNLPLALSPEMDYPRLSVNLAWTNASPEDMEALVTSRVESEVHLLTGVHRVTSVSARGSAVVSIAYKRGTDMERAELLLGDRLTSLRDELPWNMAAPLIERWQPDGREEEDFLAFQVSGPRTAEALRALLEQYAEPRLAAVPGVSGTEILGGSPRELRVDLDPEAMERGMVDAGRIAGALDGVGADVSLGSVTQGPHRVPVVAERRQALAEDMGTVVVGGPRGRPVHLAEVSAVRDTWAEPQGLARLNGMPSVQMVVLREGGTNLIRVARDVRAAIDELALELPPDLKVEVVLDESEAIRKELGILSQRAALSLVCIFVVLLLAQRRLPSAVVVLTSVLFSALGTFLLFRAVGLGIDLVTLSGLALAFGMAVDNSIVLLENIHLRARNARNRVRVLAAAREVLFPLLAGALTTAVVMTPFLYLTADLKDYYLPFVLAVTLSLLASLFVAFTLTPLLARWSESTRRIRGPELPPRVARILGMQWMGTGYEYLVRHTLAHPRITAGVSLILFAGSLWVFQTQVSRGSIFPHEPQTVLAVTLGLPPGAEVAQANDMIRDFEDSVLDHAFYETGYIKQVRTMVRMNRAFLIVEFHPAVNRTSIPEVLKQEMILLAATRAGANISVQGQGPGYSAGSGSISASYTLRVRGPDYLVLADLAEDIGRRLERHGRINDVNTNASSWMAEDAIEFAAVPRREEMGELGVTMASVSSSLQPVMGGEYASRRLASPEGEMLASVRWGTGNAPTPEKLLEATGLAPSGAVYPFREVLEVEERRVQREIQRRDQEYERLVSFEFRGPGRVGNRYLKAFLEGTEVPPGYTLEESQGVFLTSREEQQIYLALLLAMLLIFMVSAALFESLVLPFVAILSVPLSFIGVAMAFWLADESFDRTAYIGLILLAGIAINNALLLVHRAGALHRKTRRILESAHRAAVERFRPILLTTVTSVAGLAPLIWGVDPEGAASWRTLAIAATAGLLTSAVCTLLVVPPLFSLFVGRGRTPAALPAVTLSAGERGIS